MTPARMSDLHSQCFTTPRPWSSAEFIDLLSQPYVFSVTLDAGFALGRALAGEAELLTLAVDPSYRRGGVATQLLAGFDQAARDRDATEAFLEVADDNLAARSLYARCGFDLAGRRRGYYRPLVGPAIHALILRKSL